MELECGVDLILQRWVLGYFHENYTLDLIMLTILEMRSTEESLPNDRALTSKS